jgi:hypothetical protein
MERALFLFALSQIVTRCHFHVFFGDIFHQIGASDGFSLD